MMKKIVDTVYPQREEQPDYVRRDKETQVQRAFSQITQEITRLNLNLSPEEEKRCLPWLLDQLRYPNLVVVGEILRALVLGEPLTNIQQFQNLILSMRQDESMKKEAEVQRETWANFLGKQILFPAIFPDARYMVKLITDNKAAKIVGGQSYSAQLTHMNETATCRFSGNVLAVWRRRVSEEIAKFTEAYEIAPEHLVIDLPDPISVEFPRDASEPLRNRKSDPDDPSTMTVVSGPVLSPVQVKVLLDVARVEV